MPKSSRTYPMTPVQIEYIRTKTEKIPLQPKTQRPPWLKVKLPQGENFAHIKRLVKSKSLNTVCEEARCPNLAECWNRGTATFMILGDVCTRSCGFCSVKTGKPPFLDLDEPNRVAESVEQMGLKYAVITSVNRDELPDGGASIFAETIRAIRRKLPECHIEVLIPDFKGRQTALATVIAAQPNVLNHNVETTPELYQIVRPQADYQQSLELLQRAKQSDMVTKSGMMLGLGETDEQVFRVMRDLAAIGLDILTLGQYLQPTHEHLPVERFVHPDTFLDFKQKGMKMGFRHVESGLWSAVLITPMSKPP